MRKLFVVIVACKLYCIDIDVVAILYICFWNIVLVLNTTCSHQPQIKAAMRHLHQEFTQGFVSID